MLSIRIASVVVLGMGRLAMIAVRTRSMLVRMYSPRPCSGCLVLGLEFSFGLRLYLTLLLESSCESLSVVVFILVLVFAVALEPGPFFTTFFTNIHTSNGFSYG